MSTGTSACADLRRHRGHGVQRFALVHQSAQVVFLGQLGARLGAPRAGGDVFFHRGAQFQQVAHRGQQAGVVPGLGDVVGGAGLDQVHGSLQVGPGREQDDRYVGVQGAQLPEQGDAFFARSGLAAEVHVLDDQVDFLGTHGRECFGGR
jgi:hypothetical protein